MGWDRELDSIYAELEEELSRLAPPCKACGQCCHFHTFGHVLYSSNIEVEYILKNAGLPTTYTQEGVCPYLANNLCTIRQYRALGCRVFFCHPDWEESSPEIYEKYHRKIKDLSLAYHLDWYYAPMLRSLSEAHNEDYPLE
jgi:hypothetical protein